jgi:hypothetical protein
VGVVGWVDFTRRVSALAFVLVALGLSTAQAAAASWLGPTDLTPIAPTWGVPGTTVDASEVAVGGNGDAAFVWARVVGGAYRVQTRSLTASGILTPIQTLSGPGSSGAEVAVDGDGDATFAWIRSVDGSYRAQTRTRTASGSLTPVRTLSGSDASSARVAVTVDGDAIFAWTRQIGGASRVQSRARSAAGVLSPVQTLSGVVGYPFAPVPRVGLDASGNAVVAWIRDHYDEAGEDRVGVVQTRTRFTDGTLGRVQDLSAPQLGVDSVRVGVDPGGDAVFAWLCGICHAHDTVVARSRSADGSLGPVQDLSAPGQFAYEPEVAVDADGGALVTWSRFVRVPPSPDRPDDHCCYRIEGRWRSRLGALSPVRLLSPAGQDARWPDVAVDEDGDAVVTWSGDERVRARVRPAAGVLGPVSTLSAAGRRALGGAPVAMDPSGDAAVTWVGYGVRDAQVQAAVGP